MCRNMEATVLASFSIILLLLPFSCLSFTHCADDVEPSLQELTERGIRERRVALLFAERGDLRRN